MEQISMLNIFKLSFARSVPMIAASLLLTGSMALAADVKVEGVHLCCGACVKAADKALSNVNGVSVVTVDKDGESITFTAADDAAVQRGLTALADGGFYGKTSVPGPDFKIDPQAASNDVKISKIHLCCKGCVTSAEEALKGVSGVKKIDAAQSKQGLLTIHGSKVNHADVLKALHAAGFHGQVK